MRLKRKIWLIWAFLLIMLISGCGMENIAREDVPLATYVGTRASFNYYLETYLEYRAGIIDPNQLKAVRDKFEPKFITVGEALDVWGAIVTDGGDPSAAIENYNKLLTGLIMELRKAGIIVIKKEGE